MKKLMVLSIALLVVACGENSDGSKKSTYSSCRITNSDALLASNRERDLSQCWDGVDFKEKNLALDWCREKVSTYLNKQYILSHGVEFSVTSTNCLK